jgi:threonine aldolase
MKYIDLRSDTVTVPTQEMREAMYQARVGDDVYRDDPTTKSLEEYAAETVGKEAALFVPSGTFGNQLAIFTHCKHGDEVILGDDCHIVEHEVGAASVIAGVQFRTLQSNKGELNPEEIQSKIRGVNIHSPSTGLICLENAHSNGRVISLSNMEKIYEISRRYKIPIHLDGARIFNAAIYLGIDAKEITRFCDSVMFCLSKGLCAPIGSILAGCKAFIEKARKGRKLMGGGMRQTGIIAAAGLIALKKMRHRLKDDHENALLLATKLSNIPGISINLDDVHINMVYLDINKIGYDDGKLVNELYNRGIKVNPAENGIMRFVTHNQIKSSDIFYVADTIKELLSP